MTTIFPLRHLRRVYCAGPLFNEAERREMLEIAGSLAEAGFEPFVPHADGMEFSGVLAVLIDRGHDPAHAGALAHRAILALDVYQVAVGCGSLVFNMNGRVPDEGGAAEAAIAWTLGKPLVLLKNDVRSAIAGRDNPLIAGLADFEVVRDIAAVGAALHEKISQLALPSDWQTSCPPHLETLIETGRELCQRLERLAQPRSSDEAADAVLEIFDRERSAASG